ncbi:multidrug efflux system membrane fusion protein [Hasllibacter halocynthiae]|uniref:Multidrug efflux system membrane fusion protein n=1 Tax=Hasllibacter halocynthiae TaxID=595589 RepID=A0A2T0WZ97_9RHOB|nr:efflux RND transporter periplasmic adaptor subunit [Hasllibacter halocynthiae]PRY92032.1 multidrug efflux system membrane fusion protein [Hasllibacter halocynthiae]
MSETTSQAGAPDGPAPMRFEDDRGSRRSVWIALALVVAVVAWMASGLVLPAREEGALPEAPAVLPVSVATRPSAAAPVTLVFRAQGQAQPDRDTMIRAEASGDVDEVYVMKGESVEEGMVIARLTTERLDADLARAREEEVRARRELENAESLLERGVATGDRVAQARAALAGAQAQVVAAETALDGADIVAPFGGRLETMTLDEGEFVSAGAEVARLVDNRPLTVAVQVPQQELEAIEDGQPASVAFITGEERAGRVTFVGSAAASETRTFLAEIEVPNEDGAIPAGISAEVEIPTGETLAHFVQPSVISLGTEGETGVKTVEDGRVAFHEVEVVRAEIDGVWVTGLPDRVELITVGQGFVRAGEPVVARPEVEG